MFIFFTNITIFSRPFKNFGNFFIFNNNTAAVANSFAGTIPTGVATQNQFRAMEIMWTGTFWAIMGK